MSHPNTPVTPISSHYIDINDSDVNTPEDTFIDPIGYINAASQYASIPTPPVTPRDNLIDMFNDVADDEDDMATIDPPYWDPDNVPTPRYQPGPR